MLRDRTAMKYLATPKWLVLVALAVSNPLACKATPTPVGPKPPTQRVEKPAKKPGDELAEALKGLSASSSALAPFPTTVVGVAFGSTLGQVSAACKSAGGETRLEQNAALAICTVLPVDIGFPNSYAAVQLCGPEKTACEIAILTKSLGDAVEYLRRLQDLRQLLSDKYGPAKYHKSTATADATLSLQCSTAGRSESTDMWFWNDATGADVRMSGLIGLSYLCERGHTFVKVSYDDERAVRALRQQQDAETKSNY
jgi:hypothetical protein